MNNILNTVIKVIALLLLLALIWSFYSNWRNRVDSEKTIQQLAVMKDSTAFYKTKYQERIATTTSIVFSKEKDLKSIVEKNDSLKEIIKHFRHVTDVVSVKGDVIIQHDSIPYETKIQIPFKPFKVHKSNSNYVFDGTITNRSLLIDKLVIPNEQTIVFGTKPTGFLGLQNECSVDIRNSNSLVKTTGVTSFKFVPQKKWYQTTGFHVGVGVAAALLGRHYLIKYNFIK